MELDMVASMEVDKVADKHIAISVTGEFDPEPFDIHIDKSFHFKKSGKVTIHGLGSWNYLVSLELALSLGSRGYWALEFNWLHRIPSLLGYLRSLCYVWL